MHSLTKNLYYVFKTRSLELELVVHDTASDMVDIQTVISDSINIFYSKFEKLPPTQQERIRTGGSSKSV